MKRPGALLTIAVAWIGVVLGHLAACFLAYPNPHDRHVHLAVSGHSWVGLAAASLLALVPVFLLAVGAGVVRHGTWSGSGLALRLAAIQVPAFILTEVVDRHGSVADVLADPAVFIGLALQPLVAVMAAWMLDVFGRAVRAVLARQRRSHPVAPRSLPRPVPVTPLPRRPQFLPTRRRAPPFPSRV